MEIREYSKDDCKKILNFARDAAESYVIEKQRMDIGSVDDLFNRKAGVFMQIVTVDNGNIRGNSGVYGSYRLANSLISATIECVSERSLGSMISRTELSSVMFKIAPVYASYLSDSPSKDINLGYDVPIIDGDTWIYPKTPVEQDWSAKEYLRRSSRKSGLDEDYWKNNAIPILRTESFREDELVSVSETFDSFDF